MGDASSFKYQRRQLLVDPKVQGTLVARAVVYWAYSLLAITLMLLCWRVLTLPRMPALAHFREMWVQYCPVFVASLIVLPLMMIDLLRLSHRFAGPLVRLRRSLRQLAEEGQMAELHFRDADFWQDLADSLNTANARLQRSKGADLSDRRCAIYAEEEEPAVACEIKAG